MAPESLAPAWYPLRSVTQRLTSTPAKDLPHIVPFLASTVSNCGAILAETDSQSRQKSDTEAAVVVHKLKTQISTLLQDKSKEARWAAVVLVKATVVAGGCDVLQGSVSWVRALLGLLGRPEPPTTKNLSIVTLTRIFLLTNDNPSLVRDITTPSLPSFVTTCLRLSKDSKSNATQHSNINHSILSTVLWAFGKLIPQHSRTFKPFLDQIRALVLPLIAPTPSNLPLDRSSSQSGSCSEVIAQRARHAFVLLYTCALKATSNHEWENSFSLMISAAQNTIDRVFRGLSENWDPEIWNGSLKTDLPSSLEGICQMRDGESEWPGWRGVYAGLERLNGHLLTVYTYLMNSTPNPVAVPVPKLFGLIDRILAALPPSGRGLKAADTGTQTRPEIGRDEREAAWTWLPHLHVSALKILEQLVVRLEEGSMALDHQLLNSITWTFEHEHAHVEIRKAVYRILPLLFARCKAGVHRSVVPSLASCLKVCCEDLIPTQAEVKYSRGNAASTDLAPNKDPTNGDAYHKRSDAASTLSGISDDLQELAASVLSGALEYLPSGSLPFSVRSKIDRTGALARNEPILQSSVLNPATQRARKQQSSLMPLLARQFPQSSVTEALLRPRMPLLRLNTADLPGDSDDEINRSESAMPTVTYISPEAPDGLTEGDMQTSLEIDRLETLATDLERVGSYAVETQSPLSGPQMNKPPAPEAVLAAKRTRTSESDSESVNGISTDGLKQLLPPGDEPERKRMRSGDDDLYVPPTTEDDLLPPVGRGPSEYVAPAAVGRSTSAEPLTNFRTGNEKLDDDDSDDSSIPPIDPSMDTEDEEDEDEDSDAD